MLKPMPPSTSRPRLHPAALVLAAALSIGAGVPALPLPAMAQEAASAVQDVALQDLVLVFGDTKVTAPTLMVSGTRLSKDDLLAILRTDGKEPWAARLARLDAGSISAPELRVEYSKGAEHLLTTYRDAMAKGVHGGRIAELTAAGASLAVEGQGEGKAAPKGSYGKMRAEDADLAAFARLYGEPGDGKGPLLRLYGAVSVENFVFGDDDATVTLASVTGRDLMGRQIPATWSGAITSLGAFDVERNDPLERAKASGIAADLAEGVSVGGLEAAGLSIKVTKPEASELGVGRLAWAGSGTEPGLTLSDFNFSGSGTQMKLGTLKLAGFSLAPTIATLRRFAQNVAVSNAELRRLTPEIGTLSISGLSLAVPQDAAKPDADPLAEDKPADAAPLHFGLREAAITGGPPKDGVPTASRFSLAGLTLPASLFAEVPGLASLGVYGYRELDFDVVADTAWNEAAKELAFREVSLSGKNMGRLRLSATLGGVGSEMFDPDAAVSGYAMLSTTAKALDLTVENGGLFERFIDATAKSLSLKPDELRKEYVTACVIGVPAILGNSAAAKTVGAAMGKFVTKPNRLTISAKARNATGLGVVDFSTAGTPAAVLDKLDVNAKAE